MPGNGRVPATAGPWVAHVAGAPDVPQTYAELRRAFALDEDCLALVERLRWPDGFHCPDCGHREAWRMGAGEQRCAGCRRRVSATTGTIFHGTRTPLSDWFAAAWLLTQDPRGVSARDLRRRLRLGSYQTAWAILHRLRTAMAPDDGDRLTGRVHLDEVHLGRRTAGVPGRGVRGLQLTAIAVQSATGATPERVRVQVMSESSPASIRTFLLSAVEPGSAVVTDGWAAYPPACRRLWVHERHHVARAPRGRLHTPLPVVSQVDTQLNRWLVETHLASVRPKHLQNYLDEFTFRFNHGVDTNGAGSELFLALLRRAAGASPLSYRQIVGSGRSPQATEGIPA